MRILFLSDRYPPVYSGAYELDCHLAAEGLRKRGHAVSVLTSSVGRKSVGIEEHVYRKLHYNELFVRTSAQRRIMQIRSFWQGMVNYWITRRFVRQMTPDVVYAWHLWGASLLPLFAIQDLGLDIVFRLESHWLVHIKNEQINEPRRARRWFRSALMGFRRFDKIAFEKATFCSESLRQSYSQAGFNFSDSAVIPSGLPETWIACQPEKPHPSNGSIRLLYVGRLEPEKGPDVAIKAVAQLVSLLGHRRVQLDLIGGGQVDYVDQLRQMAASSGIQDIVKFRGFLPREEVMGCYSSYDALVFPTPRWEGLGVTIIEAMAQGLPVVASNIGGPKDIIRHGENGFLTTPNDFLELAQTLHDLFRAPPSFRFEMGMAAIRTVREVYALERALDRYESFLESTSATRISS